MPIYFQRCLMSISQSQLMEVSFAAVWDLTEYYSADNFSFGLTKQKGYLWSFEQNDSVHLPAFKPCCKKVFIWIHTFSHFTFFRRMVQSVLVIKRTPHCICKKIFWFQIFLWPLKKIYLSFMCIHGIKYTDGAFDFKILSNHNNLFRL